MTTAVLVYNPKSGTAQSMDALRERLRAGLAARGVEEVEERPLDTGDIRAAFRGIDAGRHALLVAAGGDGTVALAAHAAVEAGVVLALLPMGTMNLVARDLGVPLDAMEAADAIATLEERAIDVADVNGHLFVHSSVLGLVPRLGRHRERIRKAWGAPLAVARAAAGFAATALRAEPLTVTLHADGTHETFSTLALAISPNPLCGRPETPLRRDCLDSGVFGVVRSSHRGAWGRVRLLAGIGGGLWGRDPKILRLSARELEVVSRRGTVLVSNDGEPLRLEAPLKYTMRPRALRVLGARVGEGEGVGVEAMGSGQ